MWNLKNIINFKKGSLLSSIIGIGIALLAVASVFLNDKSWTEAAIGITIGLAIAGFKIDDNTPTPAVVPVIVLGLLMTVSLWSCAPSGLPLITQTDSTYTKKVLKKDTVFVPGDSVLIKIPCDEVNVKPDSKETTTALGVKKLVGTAKSKSGNAKVNIYKKDNQLYAECDFEPYTLTINRLQDEIYRLQTRTILKPVACLPYETPWYDIACRYAAGILFILTIILILIKR